MHLVPDRIYGRIDELSREFRAAAPFPCVVIEAGVADADLLLSAFPPPGWEGWHRYQDEYQLAKMICSDIEAIPSSLAGFIQELNGPRFLAFLEQLSGLDKLIPDPYLEGGGLHCSGPGGVLTTHTDFHLYKRLDLYRRLNVLIYLNDDWDESWGGCLELYAPGSDGVTQAPARMVVPKAGTMVIFRTDDRSAHGFNRPIADGRWRRSVALYYYTSEEAADYSGDTNTYWRQDREQPRLRRVRQQAYNALIFVSRSFAFIAHRLDPKVKGRS